MTKTTNTEIKRKILIAKARSRLLEAMKGFTRDCGELSCMEWLMAFQGLQDRFLVEGLSDEWKEASDDEKT